MPVLRITVNHKQNDPIFQVYHNADTHTTVLWPFFRDYPAQPCQKKSSSGFYGAREGNRGRHTDHPDGSNVKALNGKTLTRTSGLASSSLYSSMDSQERRNGPLTTPVSYVHYAVWQTNVVVIPKPYPVWPHDSVASVFRGTLMAA